jgi:hypothetical protein
MRELYWELYWELQRRGPQMPPRSPPDQRPPYQGVQRNDMPPIAPQRRPFRPHVMHLFRLVLARYRPAESRKATHLRAAAPSTASNMSKRIKLPDTNKRKTACLELTDVLQVKVGGHRGAAHISSRTKAAHNKTVKEAMELHVATRGGNKRKYALADINADVANKRLFVRKGLPPTGGSPPSHPSHQGGDHLPHPDPGPNTNGKHNTAKPATAAAPTAPTAPTATTTPLGHTT